LQTYAAGSSSKDAYPYNSSSDDSRQHKATLEHVFKPDDVSSAAGSGSQSDDTAVPGAAPPWAVGWQMNERNLVWNDQLKMQLIKVGTTSCQPQLCHALPAAGVIIYN
jgi:hypothetical protein